MKDTIGIVTTWFNRGAAFVSKNFAKTLQNEFNVEIYARSGEKYEEKDPEWNLPNVTWGKKCHKGIPTYIDWPDFQHWLAAKKPKFILFNEQHSWEIILRLKKTPIIIGAYVDYYTPTTVPFFNLYDFLICNTKKHMSVFNNHQQVFYIPWGTDIDLYKPVEKEESGKIIFFHSCGISPERKGTDLLISAFSKIKGINTKLIIHTQVPLEPFIPSIDQLTSHNIEVINKTIPPPGLYQLGDVYVYPSRLDGIGLTIAEALASGLPVVTSDNAPMNEFVVNGVNGYLIKIDHFQKRSDNYYWDECECDVKDLQRILERIIQQKNEILTLKHKARKFAEDYLDWKKNSANLNVSLQQVNKLPLDKKVYMKAALYEYFQFPRIFIKKAKFKAAYIISHKS